MWIDEVPGLIAALAPARVAVWPALGGAGVTLARAVRDGRRRTALNERLHELRRPLQALALMAPAGGAGRAVGGEGPVEMATAALARLEREINGEVVTDPRALVALRPLLEAARRRWRVQAALAGTTMSVRWDAEEAAVDGDRIELAAALDNLIANALEHGGPRIELAADLIGGRICLAVVDSGKGATRRARDRDAALRARQASGPDAARRGRGTLRGREPRGPLARLSGRARRGHGLRLVRRAAARHEGTFVLHRGESGTSAVLELPVSHPRSPSPPSPGR
jgi:signal transduction histidine kinase